MPGGGLAAEQSVGAAPDEGHQERARRASIEDRRLARQASEIARVINEHFALHRSSVPKAQALEGGGGDLGQCGVARLGAGGDLVPGQSEPALPAKTGAEVDIPEPPEHEVAELSPQRRVQTLQSGGEDDPLRGQPGQPVAFRHMGEAERRTKYVGEARQILINLDHPQIEAALAGGSQEDAPFRRLAYEVAFCEYALALATELASQDHYADTTDALWDVGDVLDRLARRASTLYREDGRPA